ncbi:MAG: hydroxylamine oxidoreductase [Nitrospirae bacterium]|nr:hydroxylamine oxidoreductase [Nitrospirota bacterium]
MPTRTALIVLSQLLLALLAALATPLRSASADSRDRFAHQKIVSEKCEVCHERSSPGIVHDWERSLHAKAEVTCIDCHEAAPSDPDARAHEGAYISAVVSPKDCSRCHPRQVAEFNQSLHAKAVSFLLNLEGDRAGDDALAYKVEGKAAAVMGCEKCHGSLVKAENGKLDPQTWPNGGIGRINPDGSRGSCSACHTRHRFSVAEARKPETCGTCHMGPDHPQYEIYMESKHGVIYASEGRSWDMEVAGKAWDTQHYRAPTCATCHMSGLGELETTHNVSDRLSWELEHPLTIKTDDWEGKRTRMKKVCLSCHSKNWVENHYVQFDNVIGLYNDDYFKPIKEAMDQLYKGGYLTEEKFDEEIEFKFFEFWHHEGRRARMGASMMGPDFTQWHGFYELAKHRLELEHMMRELREQKDRTRFAEK